MVSDIFRALVASSGLFLMSIPTNPDIPPLIRPELPPDFSVPDPFPVDEPVEITVDLKVIDRESKIKLTFLVEKKAEDKYLYTYVVKNDGDHPLAFRYAILDRFSGAEIVVFYLEPGQSRKVTVESSKSPIYVDAQAQVFLMVKPDDEVWKEDIKKAGATISGDFYHPIVGIIKGAAPNNR